MAKEAADEVERRAAEYDSRIAASQAQGRGQQQSPRKQDRGGNEPPRHRPTKQGGREDKQNGPLAILRQWLLLVLAISVVVLIVLFASNSGPISSPEVNEPVAAAIPDPADDAQVGAQVPTIVSPSAPGQATDLTEETGPSDTSRMPVEYGEWQLDCPGCPVVFLDAKEPELIGESGLHEGDDVRVIGCTDIQTALHRRFIFGTPDGKYTGVVLFRQKPPRISAGVQCLEMVGVYQGAREFSMDQRGKHQPGYNPLVSPTADIDRIIGPSWEHLGELKEFRVANWVALPAGVSVESARIHAASVPLPAPTGIPQTLEPTNAPASAALTTNAPTRPPIPGLTPEFTPSSQGTATPRPTSAPTPPSTRKPTPSLTPSYDKQLVSAKTQMLQLINEVRAEAGSPSVLMGSNQAAQIHADNALQGCFSSHWGLDGSKPYMRYTAAGGYQSNGENVAGMDICIRAGQGYASLGNPSIKVQEIMDGFMDSPGHRRTILDPAYRKVNLGIAWDRYNIRVVQHFEGDYVRFEQLPTIEDGVLSFTGTLLNGATLVPGDIKKDLGMQIHYDPPLQALSRGQLARADSYGLGPRVAAVRGPAGAGFRYTTHWFAAEYCPGSDPYAVPRDTPAPKDPLESSFRPSKPRFLTCTTATRPWLNASRWKLGTTEFEVKVSLKDILLQHGPGVYTVLLWANIDGESVAVAEYPIFHQTEPPAEYGP